MRLLAKVTLLCHWLPMSGGGFLRILEAVDSTNNYAMAQVHAGLANHGLAWFAQEQTAGKGQRGKRWQTGKGKNIAMSLVLEPERFGRIKPFLLSASIALACHEFFEKYAGPPTRIKWPNDLYWGDRKAGGILIENVYHGKKWKWAVAGTGININEDRFDPELINPVSLYQITGTQYNVPELAHELLAHLMASAARLQAGETAAILEQYNQRLYKLNEAVTLRSGDTVFSTTIRGVTEEGRLITYDTEERTFDFGEVAWLG